MPKAIQLPSLSPPISLPPSFPPFLPPSLPPSLKLLLSPSPPESSPSLLPPSSLPPACSPSLSLATEGSHSSSQPVCSACLPACLCVCVRARVRACACGYFVLWRTQPMCSAWTLLLLCLAWFSTSRQDVQHTTWPLLFFSFWPIL